jgi:CubicO group peptidase (beta-lactamase class C family)
MRQSLPTDDQLVAALKGFVPNVIDVTGTPGLSVAVARNGDVIFNEGFGFADLAARTPATAQSIYRIGSFTKLYTAIAALQLVERRIIDLYGPAQDYVADLDLRNPYGERDITVYDLLTFRSGLADEAIDCDTEWPVSNVAYLTDALADCRRREYRSAASRWNAKVGSRFQYSSLGIAVVGHIVAATNPEGLSYPAYVHRHIFEPLEMRSSYFATGEEDSVLLRELEPRLTEGYGRFGRTLVPTPTLHVLGIPGGGMCSSAKDHARVLTALLGGGELDGVRVLSPPSARMIITAQTDVGVYAAPGVMCGLGMLVRPGGADRFFGHLGAHPWGWYHGAWAYPELNVVVVVLTNRFEVSRWANSPGQIASGIISDFIVSSLSGGSGLPPRQQCSWLYKEGYTAGLLLAERTNGMLGVPCRLAAYEATELVEGARVLESGRHVEQDWRDGFVSGVRDFEEVHISPAAICAHIQSAELPVGAAELDLMARQFGQRGGLPIPHRFFASAPAISASERLGPDQTLARDVPPATPF